MKRSPEAQAERNRRTGEIAKRFKRMRDGRQQPETLIARAKEELYLPHRRNALGRVERWTLPWVEDFQQEFAATAGEEAKGHAQEVVRGCQELEAHRMNREWNAQQQARNFRQEAIAAA